MMAMMDRWIAGSLIDELGRKTARPSTLRVEPSNINTTCKVKQSFAGLSVLCGNPNLARSSDVESDV
jgi:hypothetical protein